MAVSTFVEYAGPLAGLQGLYARLQVPDLITPLGENSERVLQESNHNQETPNCRQVRFQGLRVDFDIILDRFAESAKLLKRVFGVSRTVARRLAGV